MGNSRLPVRRRCGDFSNVLWNWNRVPDLDSLLCCTIPKGSTSTPVGGENGFLFHVWMKQLSFTEYLEDTFAVKCGAQNVVIAATRTTRS